MHHKRIRLLVVDDEIRFLNTLTQRLSLRDFAVTPVTSAVEALGRKDPFDLALLNLELPEMGGGELVHLLKERHPWTEVIILAGGGRPAASAKDRAAAAFIVLQKPAETAELLRALKDAYLRRMQRKLGISALRLQELTKLSLLESPLSILRKLKELDRETTERGERAWR